MLALSCDITIPNEILKTLHKTDAEEYLIVNKLPSKSGLIGGGGGYSVEYSGLINYLKTVLLSRVKEFERLTTRKHDMRESIEKNHELWLCYRYYDRLEWAHQNSHVLYLQNLLKSQDYQLELRERTHSPRKTTDPKGRVLFEPTPIEGFLARLTDIFGDARSFIKKYYRILYFYSCDNILFYSKFYRGMPPSPNNFLINEIDLQLCDGIEQGTGLHKLANQIPQVYEHSPFPLNSEGYIKWLNESEFMINDQHAYIEMLRRTQQIVKSEGLINMCKIKQIRKVPFEDISFADRRLQQLFWYLQESDIEDESITDSVLEVEMIHGARIRLQAPNRNIRDEWINRLYELKTYWSYRKSDDLNKLLQVRQQNKNQLEINDYTDSNISAEAGKVELSNSIAHASIYNMDCMSITKYVLMSGYLYQKPKKHANFTQYFVTLCPGFLMLFRVSRRSKVTGMIKETSCYEHYMTIPLDRCYIYSGETSSLDLLLRHKEFDSQNPGQHSLPRVYPDGWRSVEEEPVRCFSLWVGKRKNLKYKVQNESTSTSVRSTAPKNPGIVSFYRKLGFTGKKIMFLARSRQERELWVTRIMTEIDRTASNEGFS